MFILFSIEASKIIIATKRITDKFVSYRMQKKKADFKGSSGS
jgi:hypothetical protein